MIGPGHHIFAWNNSIYDSVPINCRFPHQFGRQCQACIPFACLCAHAGGLGAKRLRIVA